MRALLALGVAIALAGIANVETSSCDGPNESLQSVPDCPPPKTCENKDREYDCQITDERTVKCVCNQGYVRKSNGACAKPAECDS